MKSWRLPLRRTKPKSWFAMSRIRFATSSLTLNTWTGSPWDRSSSVNTPVRLRSLRASARMGRTPMPIRRSATNGLASQGPSINSASNEHLPRVTRMPLRVTNVRMRAFGRPSGPPLAISGPINSSPGGENRRGARGPGTKATEERQPPSPEAAARAACSPAAGRRPRGRRQNRQPLRRPPQRVPGKDVHLAAPIREPS